MADAVRMTRMAADAMVGKRVTFAPNPRWPERMIEARVVRVRDAHHFFGARRLNPASGWLDAVDDAGIQRSVLPSRCVVLDSVGAEE